MSYRSSVYTDTIGTSVEQIIIDLSDDTSTEQAADYGLLDVLAKTLFGAAATTEPFQRPLAKEATSPALLVFVSSYTESLSLRSDMSSEI